jgi:hypothetical protein
MAESRAITCRELTEAVTDLMEGALDDRGRDRAIAHVAICTACAVFVEQMKLTVLLAGRLRDVRA